MSILCEEAEMAELTEALQRADGEEIVRVDRLLQAYPEDPRLHFLRGSILASIGRPIEALASLKQAVTLAPEFAIARFQLGFFQLTSGEPADALSTWGPIAMLSEGHYLRFFVGGLTHLIRDEFDDTIRRLEEGIAANLENLPLNRDMQLIIDQVRAVRETKAAGDAADDSMSATSFLLDQFTGHRPN